MRFSKVLPPFSRVLPPILACLLLAVVGCAGPGPAKTVEEFHRSLARGDVDAALACLSREVVEVLGESKLRLGLRQTVEAIEGRGGIETLEVSEGEVEDTEATVEIDVRYGNGEREEGAVKLVLEDGAWKLAPVK